MYINNSQPFQSNKVNNNQLRQESQPEQLLVHLDKWVMCKIVWLCETISLHRDRLVTICKQAFGNLHARCLWVGQIVSSTKYYYFNYTCHMEFLSIFSEKYFMKMPKTQRYKIKLHYMHFTLYIEVSCTPTQNCSYIQRRDSIKIAYPYAMQHSSIYRKNFTHPTQNFSLIIREFVYHTHNLSSVQVFSMSILRWWYSDMSTQLIQYISCSPVNVYIKQWACAL